MSQPKVFARQGGNREGVSVGREDTCTFQILDPMVSRTHLQVRFDAVSGQHIAGDYRSAHGVFVNGKQILLDLLLHDGDKIRIGQTTLMYLSVDYADAPTAMVDAIGAVQRFGDHRRKRGAHDGEIHFVADLVEAALDNGEGDGVHGRCGQQWLRGGPRGGEARILPRN